MERDAVERAALAAAWMATGQGRRRACSSKKKVKYSMHAYRKRSISSVLQKDLNLFVTLCESAESTMAARTCRRGEGERGDGVGERPRRRTFIAAEALRP